jgi:hypothetical protein
MFESPEIVNLVDPARGFCCKKDTYTPQPKQEPMAREEPGTKKTVL